MRLSLGCKRAFLFFLTLLAALSARCAAQSAPRNDVFTNAEHGGGNEFTVWGGYSPNSPKLIGVTEDRHVTMLGFGYARVLLATDLVAWKFTIDTVPLILVSQPTFTALRSLSPAAYLLHSDRSSPGGRHTASDLCPSDSSSIFVHGRESSRSPASMAVLRSLHRAMFPYRRQRTSTSCFLLVRECRSLPASRARSHWAIAFTTSQTLTPEIRLIRGSIRTSSTRRTRFTTNCVSFLATKAKDGHDPYLRCDFDSRSLARNSSFFGTYPDLISLNWVQLMRRSESVNR